MTKHQYLGPFSFRHYRRLRKRARFWRAVGRYMVFIGAELISFAEECDNRANKKITEAEMEWDEVVGVMRRIDHGFH